MEYSAGIGPSASTSTTIKLTSGRLTAQQRVVTDSQFFPQAVRGHRSPAARLLRQIDRFTLATMDKVMKQQFGLIQRPWGVYHRKNKTRGETGLPGA